MLAVSDTGVGMSAETVAHIFEPFFTTKGASAWNGAGFGDDVWNREAERWIHLGIQRARTRDHVQSILAADLRKQRKRVRGGKGKNGGAEGLRDDLLVEDDEAVRELTEMVLKRMVTTCWWQKKPRMPRNCRIRRDWTLAGADGRGDADDERARIGESD
jgi:hypothetical protein